MNDVFVRGCDSNSLMPTTRVKARKLIKTGRAEIFKYWPFTIRLLQETSNNVQPIELCVDSGAKHIGVSLKSQKHEFVHSQFDLLDAEKMNHESRLSNRRTRRNRLRYREARFNNRTSSKKEGWLAPSVKNIKDRHIDLINVLCELTPVTEVIVEVGQFDTSQMRALEKGLVLEGVDYQKGLKYQKASIREAVFARDNYICQCCGKSIKDGAILKTHHNVHRSKGGSDSADNLVTVCEKCHTPKNHKPGGKLESGAFKKIKPLKDASYMNIVRWYLINEIKLLPTIIENNIDVKHTYGAYTKVSRRDLGKLKKTHANDAYAMGKFFPKHKHKEEIYKKQRRTTRAFDSFHDAEYIDIRDGKKKKGSELSCGRTNRSEKRNSDKNERIFRKQKVRKGFRQINKTKPRKEFYKGDLILILEDIENTGAKNRRAYKKGDKFICQGTASYGRYIYDNGFVVPASKCKVLKRCRFQRVWELNYTQT